MRELPPTPPSETEHSSPNEIEAAHALLMLGRGKALEAVRSLGGAKQKKVPTKAQVDNDMRIIEDITQPLSKVKHISKIDIQNLKNRITQKEPESESDMSVGHTRHTLAKNRAFERYLALKGRK